MLTGQELYLWERAGYFIHRNKLVHQEISLIDSLDRINIKSALLLLGIPEVLETLIDLHPEMRLVRISCYDQSVNQPHVSLPEVHDLFHLANISNMPAEKDSLILRIAILTDECLQVLPGSHCSPVHAEAYQEISIQGAKNEIPVRLKPGDFVCFHANLVHHDEESENSPRKTLEYIFFPLYGEPLMDSCAPPFEAPRSLYRFFGGMNDG